MIVMYRFSHAGSICAGDYLYHYPEPLKAAAAPIVVPEDADAASQAPPPVVSKAVPTYKYT